MSKTTFNRFWAFALLATPIILVASTFGQTTFPANAGTLGAIPDAPNCTGTAGAPREVTFTVSGMAAPLTDVKVDMTLNPAHTWAGDLDVILRAPGGTPSHVIYSFTGGDDSSNIAGPYLFFDTAPAAPTWWNAALAVGATVAIPSGSYRTSNDAGANTLVTPVFAGLTAGQINGTWTLSFVDFCAGDTGTVSVASLSLTATATAPPNAPNDVTGDGKTDFIIVRADGPVSLSDYMGVNDNTGKDKVANMQRRAELSPAATGIGWWLASNTGTSGAYIARRDLGLNTDFFMVEDLVGDSKDDLVVWSPGAATVAAFKILDSGTFTVTTIPYGQTGDDPTILGDYSGDGKGDLAVYRDGTGASLQSFFFWSTTAAPSTVNYLPWGTDGDIGFALDYDGDNRNDAAVQRNGGGGIGQFWIRQSSNGAVVQVIYGLSSDLVLPGDYDGDGRDDICVSRNADLGAGVRKYFWILESDGGGLPGAPIQWGIPNDFITQGDYDGDGRTDVGVWRPNADPTLNYFYARKSSDGGLLQFEWGSSGDYPVNNWNVH